MNPGLVLATVPLFPGNLRSFHMSHKIITATVVLKGPMRALQGLKCLDSHHKSQWKEYCPCVKIVSFHMPPLIIFWSCHHFSPHGCFMQVRLLLSHHLFLQPEPLWRKASPISMLCCGIASPSRHCPLQVDCSSAWSFLLLWRLNCSLAAHIFGWSSGWWPSFPMHILVQNQVMIHQFCCIPPSGVKDGLYLFLPPFNSGSLSLAPLSKCLFSSLFSLKSFPWILVLCFHSPIF